MKKDTAVAILVGFALGLIVAVSVVKLPGILKSGIKLSFNLPKLSFSQSKPTPSPIPKTQISPSLEITSPQSADVLTDKNKIHLSGKTKKGSFITIETNLDTQVIKADNGAFQSDLSLEEGTNSILIVSYIDQQTFDSKSITVSYTPEKL